MGPSPDRSTVPAATWQPVVKVLRERGREVFRQIKAPNRRHTGSIPRFGNAELAEKIRPRRGLTFATGCSHHRLVDDVLRPLRVGLETPCHLEQESHHPVHVLLGADRDVDHGPGPVVSESASDRLSWQPHHSVDRHDRAPPHRGETPGGRPVESAGRGMTTRQFSARAYGKAASQELFSSHFFRNCSSSPVTSKATR